MMKGIEINPEKVEYAEFFREEDYSDITIKEHDGREIKLSLIHGAAQGLYENLKNADIPIKVFQGKDFYYVLKTIEPHPQDGKYYYAHDFGEDSLMMVSDFKMADVLENKKEAIKALTVFPRLMEKLEILRVIKKETSS